MILILSMIGERTPFKKLPLTNIITDANCVDLFIVHRNKICFGICQSKRFNSQLQKDLFEMADNGIDTTMSLDYLPYLRMIAFHENKVYLASQKIMDDSEQSARSSRSSKRRGPSSGRSHYLASEYRNLEHVLSELGSSYLMED